MSIPDHAGRPATASPAASGRAWVVALLPSLGAAVVAVLALTAADLPDRVASHWGVGGQPDGSAPAGLLPGLVAVGGLGLLATIGGLVRAPNRSSAPPAVAVGTWWTAFFCLVAAWTAMANDGVVDWRDATPLTGLRAGTTLVAVIVVPLVAAGLTAVWLRRLLPDQPRPAGEADDVLPTIGLADGEVATWSRSSSFGWVGASLLPIAVVGIVVALTVDGLLGWILVLTSLPLALVFSRVRVQVGAEGLTTRFGWLGWPKVRIPLGEVERARVEPDLVPLEWGGWGYRGSLAIAGRAAVVHRRGPAIVVELTEGRRFAVTCDDPEVGAGLLNDLRARAVEPA